VSALVIDASIAIKWVIEEEGTKKALTQRNQALARSIC
jgi:predicted nucleic acid-binding protein